MHPFPAEHDQQQAHALEVLREAKAFILVHFPEKSEECDHPFCAVMHQHHVTRVVASCSPQHFHHAMEALAQEVMITASIEALMNLGPEQRDQIAGILRREEGAFFRLGDDDV